MSSASVSPEQVAKLWATHYLDNTVSQQFINLLRAATPQVADAQIVRLYAQVPWETHPAAQSWARLWTQWWRANWARHPQWQTDAVGTRKLPKSLAYVTYAYQYWDVHGPETFDSKLVQATKDIRDKWARFMDEAHWAQRNRNMHERVIALQVILGCLRDLASVPEVTTLLYPETEYSFAIAVADIFPAKKDVVHTAVSLLEQNDTAGLIHYVHDTFTAQNNPAVLPLSAETTFQV